MKTTPSRILIPALTLAATTLLTAQTAPPIPVGPGAPPTRQPKPPAQPAPTPAVPTPSPEIIPPTVTPAVPAAPAVPLVPPSITPPVVPPTVTPPATQPPAAPKPVQLTLPTPPASIGSGVITGTRVSARGKATVHSQLVFRFGQNEPVNLLEEITLAEPKAGEPRKWYRVQVPLDAGLWVHHQFLHNQRIVTIVGSDGKPSPHTYASVKPNRLNVRGGAGDAFPVLGQLPQGTDVALTGAQKGKWLEIFAPSNCSVYVASQFVKRANGNVANVAKVPTLPIQPQPDIQPQPPIILPLQPAQPGTIAPSVPGATPAVPAETTITVDPKTFGTPGGTTTPGGISILPKPPKPTAPAITKPIEPAKPAVPTKPVQVAKANPNLPPPSKPVLDKNGAPIRIVTREGIVHRTLSLSAPSRYVLEHLESGKTINFLITQHPTLEKKMEKLLGRRILVSGQEAMDARNQHTPVLIIKTLKTTDDTDK
ncbi:SH3 domain-containing protein [Verrucomicrobia bacterium]|nr:SH3 domain-containing protein [Verrucomicrobiota bacterium]